jgi:hypothetical protein
MAVKTLYLKNVVVNGALSLQDGGTAPTAGITTTGWQVAKSASPNFSLMAVGTEKTAFVTTDALTTPALTAASSWRSEQPFTGVFANTNWSLVFRVRAVSAASAQTGAVKVRIWKSTSADGSTGNTQLTSGILTGTTTAALSTTVSQSSTVTWTPGATQTFLNEYLFVQCEWSIVAASGSNTGDVDFYIESTGAITTSDFVPSIAGTLAATGAIDTASSTGGIFATGTLAATDDIDTSSITGGIFGTGALAATETIDTASLAGNIAGVGSTPVAFRGRTIVEGNSGTIAWPLGIAAGDSATLLLFGNGTHAITGSDWTEDVNQVPLGGGGSYYSVWSKASLSAAEIATPFNYSGSDFGGYDLYVVTGANGLKFIGAHLSNVTEAVNTIPGFTKDPASSLISTSIVDRSTFAVTITPSAGFSNRVQFATTYFTSNNADIDAADYINGASVQWSGLDSSQVSGAVLYEFTAPAGGPASITGTGVLASGASTLIGVAAAVTTGTLAATDPIDTASLTGGISSTGTLAATGALDTSNFTGVGASSGNGIIAASASTLTGLGVTASTGTGVLVAGASSVAGIGITASRGTAVIAASPSLLTGSGVVVSVGQGIGQLAASPSTLSGSGTAQWISSGVLSATAAAISGNGVSAWIATGVVNAHSAAVIGSGTAYTVATGILNASASTLSGSGFIASVTTGSLAAGASAVLGSGNLVSVLSGALASQPSTVAGTGISASIGFGILTAGAATVLGTSGPLIVIGNGQLNAAAAKLTGNGVTITYSTGILNAGVASLNGSGFIASVGGGALNSTSSVIVGSGSSATTFTGNLVARSSSVTGSGAVATVVVGALNASAASIAGSGQVLARITGEGTLVAASSVLIGSGQIFDKILGEGELVVRASILSGDGQVYFDLPGVGVLVAGPAKLLGHGAAEIDEVPRTIHSVDQDRITVSSSRTRITTSYPTPDRVIKSPDGEVREVEPGVPVRSVSGSTHSRVI